MFLTEQRATTKLQRKAMLKLMDLDYRIQYKQGFTNLAVDALSRVTQEDQSILAISVCQLSWLQILQEGYLQDPEAKTKLTELSLTGGDDKGFSLKDGIIRFRDRIWVGNNAIAQRHILQAMHSSGLGGHLGITATYHRVKSLFAWPQLKTYVTEYIQACQVCQQAKPEHVKLPGLLQPLPVPPKHGRQLVLISLKDCQSQIPMMCCWWSLTDFQSMHISFHCPIHIQHCKLLRHF